MPRTLIALAGACLLVVAVVVPVAAENPNVPDGDNFNVLFAGPPASYPAGEPFHVIQGHCLTPGEHDPVGHWVFALEVDGQPQDHGRNIVEGESDDCMALGEVMRRQTLFNFSEGLPAGKYTFRGFWHSPSGVFTWPLLAEDTYEVCFYEVDDSEC